LRFVVDVFLEYTVDAKTCRGLLWRGGGVLRVNVSRGHHIEVIKHHVI